MRHFARFTPTIYWTTRAAPSCERSPFRPTIHAPFFPAWDVDVILREFTVSLARRHALHTPLPTAGCVIHLLCTSRVSLYTECNKDLGSSSEIRPVIHRFNIASCQNFTALLFTFLCNFSYVYKIQCYYLFILYLSYLFNYLLFIIQII